MFSNCRNSKRQALFAAAAVAVAMLQGAPARAAGLLVADGGLGGVLQIKEHNAHVTVNNGVAVTEVEQVFVNTEKRIVEALFMFPVPNGGSVATFSMWIGGKEMVGEVVEKERARQIYDSYKRVQRDPGLLEQVDYKTFEMRIFPIPPGAEQRVRVTYYQELDFDHDSATYVYPLATTTKESIDQQTTGRFSLTFDVRSEIPIESMKSPSHADEFAIVKHADNHYWQASLEASGGDLSRDLVIAFRTERARTGLDMIASRVPGEDGYFQLTLTAGKELDDAASGADYVFLLDVSGSMGRDSKLGLSRNSVAAFVDSLAEDDRFELIAFNTGAQMLFNSLAAGDNAHKQQARQFLDSQKARGGTILRPPMDAAYKYRDADRPLNVVVLSDGMTEQTEQRELLDLIRRRPPGATVFCVGVGNDVNRPLLTQLAHDAGGLAAFISAGDDFTRQAEAFRRKLTRPAGRNLKIAMLGCEVYDVEPKELPNLYHGQPLRMYGRYRKSGTVDVQIEADILGNPLRQTVKLDLPQRDENNPEIERMWASHRVQHLMEDARRAGSPGSTRDEIVRLCEGYSIASEYASFIVLENDQEFSRWKIERRNATRIQRDRQAQTAVRQKLAQLRRQTETALGPAQSGKEPSQSTVTPKAGSTPATPEIAQAPGFSAPLGEERDLRIGPTTTSSGGGHGGGAIDPLTAFAGIALAGASLAARLRMAARRKRGRHSLN